MIPSVKNIRCLKMIFAMVMKTRGIKENSINSSPAQHKILLDVKVARIGKGGRCF
jgi:hypothetical protein